MKQESYQGRITTTVDKGTNANGKVFAKFTIKPGRQLIDCIIWGSFIDPACPVHLLEKGQDVLVKGFWGEAKKGAWGGGKAEFVVKWFSLIGSEEEQRESLNEQIYSYYGGRERYQEAKLLEEESFRSQGFVRVSIGGRACWTKREWAVKYKGRYWDRMEYLLDVLGPEKVREGLGGMSFSRNFDNDKYLEKLKALLGLANYVQEEHERQNGFGERP